jgi:hypothetical protein
LNSYNERLTDLVNDHADTGAAVGEIIGPLVNLAVSTLANAVVTNKLEAVEEIENLHKTIETLYEDYLRAYLQAA